MGTGIVGIIPITLENIEPQDKYFNKGFFKNYDILNQEENIFIIKEKVLLKNYFDFLLEFYGLIEEEIPEDGDFQTYGFSPKTKSLKGIKSLEEFEKKFSSENRNARVPFVSGGYLSFSTLGCDSLKFFIFYSGSYKAIFEEYRTFIHFEKVLSKAMENPLAKSIKIGLFG